MFCSLDHSRNQHISIHHVGPLFSHFSRDIIAMPGEWNCGEFMGRRGRLMPTSARTCAELAASSYVPTPFTRLCRHPQNNLDRVCALPSAGLMWSALSVTGCCAIGTVPVVFPPAKLLPPVPSALSFAALLQLAWHASMIILCALLVNMSSWCQRYRQLSTSGGREHAFFPPSRYVMLACALCPRLAA